MWGIEDGYLIFSGGGKLQRYTKTKTNKQNKTKQIKF